ncbi:hypothetical protein AUP68_10008 [Ilyonectria robusta]
MKGRNYAEIQEMFDKRIPARQFKGYVCSVQDEVVAKRIELEEFNERPLLLTQEKAERDRPDGESNISLAEDTIERSDDLMKSDTSDGLHNNSEPRFLGLLGLHSVHCLIAAGHALISLSEVRPSSEHASGD